MSQENGRKNPFVGYDYQEITTSSEHASLLMDCYENFGWTIDENRSGQMFHHHVTLYMRRDRKIINKMELTRLQRYFEACLKEIKSLERSKKTAASAAAITVGIIGCSFLAGSVFAISHVPPMKLLCALLGLPGLLCWGVSYFVYQIVYRKQVKKLQPFIENKYEEIYTICEKGHSLLN